jgi:hypothetical protein
MMDERHCENITTEALSQITPKLGKVNSSMPAKRSAEVQFARPIQR